jgi:hypothetical protein
MREICPKLTCFSLLGVVALILGACMQPIGIQPLFENIDDGTEGSLEIIFSYVHPDYFEPDTEISRGGMGRTRDNPVILHRTRVGGLPDYMIIMVSNKDDYKKIEWYYDKTILSTELPYIYIAMAGVAPFDKAGLYHLIVVGITEDDVPYSTPIYIRYTGL